MRVFRLACLNWPVNPVPFPRPSYASPTPPLGGSNEPPGSLQSVGTAACVPAGVVFALAGPSSWRIRVLIAAGVVSRPLLPTPLRVLVVHHLPRCISAGMWFVRLLSLHGGLGSHPLRKPFFNIPPPRPLLSDTWGGGGQIGPPGFWLTHPPTHIRKFFLRKKMKFIKWARTWRSILGTQTFFSPLTHPPTTPPRYSINQPLSKGLPPSPAALWAVPGGIARPYPLQCSADTPRP